MTCSTRTLAADGRSRVRPRRASDPRVVERGLERLARMPRSCRWHRRRRRCWRSAPGAPRSARVGSARLLICSERRSPPGSWMAAIAVIVDPSSVISTWTARSACPRPGRRRSRVPACAELRSSRSRRSARRAGARCRRAVVPPGAAASIVARAGGGAGVGRRAEADRGGRARCPVRPRAIAPRFGNTMLTLQCVGGDVGGWSGTSLTMTVRGPRRVLVSRRTARRGGGGSAGPGRGDGPRPRPSCRSARTGTRRGSRCPARAGGCASARTGRRRRALSCAAAAVTDDVRDTGAAVPGELLELVAEHEVERVARAVDEREVAGVRRAATPAARAAARSDPAGDQRHLRPGPSRRR